MPLTGFIFVVNENYFDDKFFCKLAQDSFSLRHISSEVQLISKYFLKSSKHSVPCALICQDFISRITQHIFTCSKSTIETIEIWYEICCMKWYEGMKYVCRSGLFIDNFEHVILFLVFLLLTLNMWFAGIDWFEAYSRENCHCFNPYIIPIVVSIFPSIPQ